MNPSKPFIVSVLVIITLDIVDVQDTSSISPTSTISKLMSHTEKSSITLAPTLHVNYDSVNSRKITDAFHEFSPKHSTPYSTIMVSSLQATPLQLKTSTVQIAPTRSGTTNKVQQKKIKDKSKTFGIRNCPNECSCEQCTDKVDRIQLKCRTNNLKNFLRKSVTLKGKVCRLNLAKSNISSLWRDAFKGCRNLKCLILDHNNLTTLEQGIFKGLKKLHTLSIRHNNLRRWQGNLWKDLPSLKLLNVQGNHHLKLSRLLLENTTITSILGFSASSSCRDCNMTRHNATLELLLPNSKSCEYLPQEYLPIAEYLISKFVLFVGKCKGGISCRIRMTSTGIVKKLIRNKCWEMVSTLRPIVLILGIVAIVCNLVVFMVIVAMKSLRSKTTFLLIAHMAFCDILLGIYAVAIGVSQGLVDKNSITFRKWRHDMCPYYRTLFVLGQIMEVTTSLLVTTERHLVVVFCMNPSVRLTKKRASILLLFFWIFSAIMCYMVQVHDAAVITDNIMCFIVRTLERHEEIDLFISQGLMIVLVLLYFVTMVQYCHIFIVARRSAQNSGARRESKLAFRIALMVVSGFIFLAVPYLVIVVSTVGSLGMGAEPQATVIQIWLPQVLLVFNAALNPFLFAYRNEKFVSALKLFITKISSCNSSDVIETYGNHANILEMEVRRSRGQGQEALDASQLNQAFDMGVTDTIEKHLETS